MRRVGLAAIAALALALAGLGVGLAISPARAPQSLAAPQQIDTLPATASTFDDAHAVTVQVSASDSVALTSPMPGILTGLEATAGGELSSGQQVATVEGISLVALATSVPLWRDLSPGDKGADVSALQAELARLGKSVTQTGTLDAATRKAAAELLGEKSLEAVPAGRWLWLPGPTVRVEKVNARIGQRLGEDTAILELPDPGASARIATLPENLYPGDRVFVLGEQEFATDHTGAILDISALLATPNYQQSKEGENSGVSGQWRLAEPIEVYAISPTSLFGLAGNQGCVAVSGEAVPVTIVTSTLGQTLVTSQQPLSEVDAHPDSAATCPSS